MDYAQLVKTGIAKRAFVPVERIRDDTELGKLALDSFALVELLIDLEQTHGIRLRVNDLGDLRTVRDLTRVVEARAAP